MKMEINYINITVLASVFIGCLIIVGHIPNTVAIDCYNCTNIPNASECHILMTCDSSVESCFVYSEGTGDNRTYTLGCNDNDMCKEHVTMTTSLTTMPTTMTTNDTDYNTTDVANTTSPSPTNWTLTTPDITTPKMSTPTMTTAFTIDNNSTDNQTISTSPVTTIPSPTGGAPMVGKRQMAAPTASSDKCMECCSTDMCNKHQCDVKPILIPTHPANAHPCTDQKGTQFCEDAKKYFSACDNITIAKNICKKTCDLCDLVDGNWSSWGNWSSCDVTCGNGTRMRMRECNDPEPKAGGDNCTGSDTESEFCAMRDCPVDGDWTDWSKWSPCSVTCGVGLQKRHRNCSDPYPDAEGLFCLGDSVDEQICFETHCHDGEWQDWSSWTECSASCGTGLKVRYRNCSEASFFGQACVGDAHETELCTEKKCQGSVEGITIGEWSPWEGWGACSKTCGVGMKIRTRDCNDTVCVGDSHMFALCEQDKCKEEVPAFLVTGVSKNGPDNGTIILSKVITNVGDVYNTTTGQFVCEVPGIYNFFISIEKQPDVNQAFCNLVKNDENTIFVGSRSAFIHDSVYQQASNSAVLVLEKGDIVYLGECSDASTFTIKTTFSGSLIH